MGPDMPERGSKRLRCQSSEQIKNFFGSIQMISCRDCWPLTKPGYITMTRRQSNNQWNGSIAVHPAPKNSKCKNPLENFRLDFLGSRRDPPHWLSSKRPNYQRGVLLISAGAIKGHFEEKPHGNLPRWSCSSTTMPRLTGHLQPRRNWPPWASSVLITHPILQIWTCRTTTFTLDWKINWKVTIFHPTRRPLLPQRPSCTDKKAEFFFEWLSKARATG